MGSIRPAVAPARTILTLALMWLHLPVTAEANVLVNDNAGALGHTRFSQLGASTLVFGSTVIVIYTDSALVNSIPNRMAGVARSIDGGQSFTDLGALSSVSEGDIALGHIVRHDASGTLYATAARFPLGGISVYRSFNDGLSFAPAITVNISELQYGTRSSIATDNAAGFGNGILYVALEDRGSNPGIRFFRSGTGGVTWIDPVQLRFGFNLSSPQIVVAPDHRVIVAFVDRNSPARIIIRSSSDLGVTFGPETTAVTLDSLGLLDLAGVRQGTTTAASFRAIVEPRLGVNPVTGQLYLAYVDDPAGADKADIFLKVSNDGGATWSDATRMNLDPGTNDQWQPALAVTPDGRFLGVFWYDRRNDPENNRIQYVGRQCALEAITNPTCGAEELVSDTSFLPEFGRDSSLDPVYAGDYDDVSATNEFFHVSWGDNRLDLAGGSGRKDPNVFHRAVAVPEPRGIGLLCAGLIAIGWMRRRQIPRTTDEPLQFISCVGRGDGRRRRAEEPPTGVEVSR